MQRITAGLTVSVASIDAYMRHCPREFRRILENIAGDLAAGRIRPSIFETLPLSEGSRAHSMLESGASTGKLVFNMIHDLA